MESPAAQGESPVAESPERPSGIPSKAGHVKPRPNPGGPPSKAKYSAMTDSEQVPRGKGEKNPVEGSERDLKSCAHKLWRRRKTLPFAFCIMSPRVTLRCEVNPEGEPERKRARNARE